MQHTFHIKDSSNPKAKAFLEFIKTLDFISVNESTDFDIPKWQQEITLKRMEELEKDKSKSVDFDQMIEKLERKHGL